MFGYDLPFQMKYCTEGFGTKNDCCQGICVTVVVVMEALRVVVVVVVAVVWLCYKLSVT